MKVKGGKDRSEKTVSQLHAGSGNIYNGDALFYRDGLEIISALGRACSDARPFALGISGVQNIDGNILLYCWQYGSRVQDFGSEVGELCCFIEADYLDAPGIGAHARVGRHHAIHICPYLDAFGSQAGASDGGGIVWSTAAGGGAGSGPVR